MKKISFLSAFFMGAFAQFSDAQTFVDTVPANRNMVLEELTGIYCQFCPDGHAVANSIYAADPSRVVLINIHAGGFATPSNGAPDFRSAVGNALNTAFRPDGYPSGVVNRRGLQFGDGDTLAAGRGVWESRADAIKLMQSPVNVAARCTINLDNRQLRMTVEAYYTGNGNGTQDRFNAFILQNNVEGPQTGGTTWNPSQVLPNGNYRHMHALRAALTPTWGDVVSTNTQGTFYTNRYTATIPANYNNIPALLGDLEVAVFMTDSLMDTYTGMKAEMYYETATPLNVQSRTIASNLALNTACGNTAEPTLTFTNMGSNDISSLRVQYTNNGGTPVAQTINLTTPVPTAGSVMFNVPGVALSTGANALSFTVTEINGTAYTGNATALNTTINTASVVSSSADSLIFNILFDQYPEEVSYTIRNETANTVVANVAFTAAAIPDGAARRYAFPLIDGNCYSFEIRDRAGDGICCGYGNGNFNVTTGATTILTSTGSYGAGLGTKFNWSRVVGVQNIEEAAQAVRLYPNPVKENFTLEFELATAADMNISINNALGQTIREIQNGNMSAGSHQLNINSNELPNGTYFVTFRQDGKTSTKRFNVMR